MLKYITLLTGLMMVITLCKNDDFLGRFIDSEPGKYFSVCWKIKNTLAKHSGLKDCSTADAGGMSRGLKRE